MTDSNRQANDLPALIDERRRYEGWLTALDARRESTPQHVYDRVRADYESRLRQVEERLASHRHAIEEERTSLGSRRSLLEAEAQLRRDERAELELRSHVGELSGNAADDAFKAVDDALSVMSDENDKLAARIAELDALLENRAPTPAAPALPTVPADATGSGDGAGAAEAAASNADEDAEFEAWPKPTERASGARPRLSGETSGDKTGGYTTGGTFDELAFMSDVVGQPPVTSAGVVKDDAAAESLLDGVHGHTSSGREPPLAANVPANTPIVLRTSGALEQAKTLKCSECGAMNYPTEWYCERCGAELAAL